jgi:hypothetical protein
MKSSTTAEFWECYSRLPPHIKQLARRTSRLWAQDPHHRSLHFKKIGHVWSAGIGLHHRALGLMKGDTVVWFWVGSHEEYDRILASGTVQ